MYSKVSHLDKLVMCYALLDIVDKLYISGDLALIFLAVTSGLQYEFDQRLTKFVELVVNYSKDLNKEIILPVDLTLQKTPTRL